MDKCHRNRITIVRVEKTFFGVKESKEVEFGNHDFGAWSEPKFRASEFRDNGKKKVGFGNFYQCRVCSICRIVDERIAA